MGKYIKLFETHTEYATYIGGSDKVLPNVSYCEDENEVHYNPWTDPRIVAKYNVADASESTKLCEVEEASSPTSLYSKINIDGVEVSPSTLFENEGYYQFDTTGEHIVKYTLINNTSIDVNAFIGCSGLTSITIPSSVTSIDDGAFTFCTKLSSVTIPNSVTSIGDSAFLYCTSLTSVTIPNSVTSIGGSAFAGCSGLTNITIPNSVTTIGSEAFYDCSGLNNITSLATTAPTISNSTFENIKTGGTLTVPSGSSGYDVWMGTGNYYLGKYSWTKVEQ